MFKLLRVRWKLFLLEQDSPDEVAKVLEARGITGFRRSATACPVARYLGDGSVNARYADVGHRRTNVPPNVGEFIRNFDRGAYSFLEA